MKKRILSVLLTMALMFSVMVAPVGAEAQQTSDCPCGCGQDTKQIQYKPWTGEPITGHYYLTDDYALGVQKTVYSGSNVALDLRGHHLTTADYSRLFLIYGSLYIFDSVGGGCISAKTTGAAVGGAFLVNYNNGDTGVLKLRNVTLMPHKDNKSAKNGGLIYVSTDCTLEMDGCTVLGGTSTTNGGALYGIAGSRIEIRNSRFFGCSAAQYGGSIYSAGSLRMENTQLWGGEADYSGGNIYKTGGELILDHCDLAYGSSYGTASAEGNKYGGGNLCSVVDATLDIRDCRIRDGYSYYSGGNVYLTSGEQNFTDTVITGGVSRQYGANLACFTTTANTTLNSCSISGNVRYGAGTLTLKGATKIGLCNNGLDLYGSETTVIQAAGLTDGAEIFVEANGVFTEPGAKAEYFKPAIRTGAITDDGNGSLTAKQTASGQMGGYCPHPTIPKIPKRWCGHNLAMKRPVMPLMQTIICTPVTTT